MAKALFAVRQCIENAEIVAMAFAEIGDAMDSAEGLLKYTLRAALADAEGLARDDARQLGRRAPELGQKFSDRGRAICIPGSGFSLTGSNLKLILIFLSPNF